MPERFKRDSRVINVLAENFETFDSDGKVGEARNIKLKLQFKDGAQVPKSGMAKLDRDRSEFFDRTIDEWLRKKYIERDHFATWVFYPVIVDKKGPKRFRLCYNFQPLNEVIYDSDYQQDDADEIIAEAYEAIFLFTIDLAEAHNQILMDLESAGMIAIWTNRGLMRILRAMFGMLPISKVFQQGLYRSIGHLRNHGVRFYADDIIIMAKTFE